MAKAKASELVDFASDVAEQIKTNRRNILANAETIIRQALEERRELDYSELDFLRVEAGYDDKKINDEKRRLNRVISLQMAAGTTADRQALAKQVSAADDVLAKRGPELAEEIAKLQAELAGIEKDASTLNRRQEEVHSALDGLTKVVPAIVASANAAKRGSIKLSLGRALGDAKIDLQLIQTLLAGPDGHRDQGNYWRSLQSYDRSLVVEGLRGQQIEFAYSDKWPAAKAEMEASIADREADIAGLQKQLDEELASLQSELQIYWR